VQGPGVEHREVRAIALSEQQGNLSAPEDHALGAAGAQPVDDLEIGIAGGGREPAATQLLEDDVIDRLLFAGFREQDV
jgi:hypothetical protein